MESVRFDRAVAFYDATRGLAPGTAERIRDSIIAQTGASRQTRFLEIGVGTGRIALPFLAAGYRYVGVDLSRLMLDVLRAKLPAGAPSPVVAGNVSQLPFADASFDVIVGVHILHLVAGWQDVLREARRVLCRPGGQLLLAWESGPAVRQAEARLPPPLQAQGAWHRIVSELGYPGGEGQPGKRPQDPVVRAELEGLGATVEELELTHYDRPARSARQVVQNYRDRIYSSDWARPDAVHNAAVERMEQWLATECANPDQGYVIAGLFKALLARWS
jgi:SAM-dependent methyltransferase